MTTTLIDVTAAASTTLDLSGVTTTVLSALASALLLWAAVKIFMAYASRSWGLIVTEIIAVIVVGFFIWTPTQAIDMLKSVTGGIFGTA